MKSDLILTSTKDMTHDDWLAFRQNGIGGSEVATVMGLNPWKASIELFYEKIGAPVFRTENLAMFLGKETEPLIANMWQYWPLDDSGEAGMIANYRSGTIVRKCRRLNAYAVNPKYPWLFASTDRIINRQPGRGEGILEVKNISGYAADQWEAGFPPSYVIQIETYLTIFEMLYGESAIMKDGRQFYVLPFEFDLSISDNIVRTTKAFWDKVVQARVIMTQKFEAERVFNAKMVDECDAALQELEPEPDGSEAFNNFLKEKYRIALPGERPGTPEQLADAISHKICKNTIKEIQESAQLHENRLKNDFGQLECDKLDFGKDGYVSWKTNTNGSRVFLNKVKGA